MKIRQNLRRKDNQQSEIEVITVKDLKSSCYMPLSKHSQNKCKEIKSLAKK